MMKTREYVLITLGLYARYNVEVKMYTVHTFSAEFSHCLVFHDTEDREVVVLVQNLDP